jgi:glycosyltransferase involved in cell wall biosynthesis
MKVSIITPVLNGELYFHKCLESVANQEQIDFEHIVVDGGSSDSSLSIANKFNVNLIVAPNTSIYEANNLGIDNATGDIICFLNSDDFFSSNHSLYNVVRFFSFNPDIQILYGNVHIVDLNGNLLYDYVPLQKFNYFLLKLVFFIVPHSSTFFKKEVFTKIGKYDTDLRYSSDLEYIFRILRNGLNIKYENFFFSSFTRHHSNKSDDFQSKNDFLTISKKYNFFFHPYLQSFFYLLVNIFNYKYLFFLVKRLFS